MEEFSGVVSRGFQLAGVPPDETRSDLFSPMPAQIERHPIDACFFEMCPKLSMQQRLYGYAGCVCLGMILNLGSWARLTELANGNPTPFVTLFTIGNIISLVGSFFLNGPYAQGKKMVGPEMRCATVTYLLAMILTFYVAYTTEITNDGERLGLVILLIVVQYLAMVWFIICSVTFLKRIVLACVRGTCTQVGGRADSLTHLLTMPQFSRVCGGHVSSGAHRAPRPAPVCMRPWRPRRSVS